MFMFIVQGKTIGHGIIWILNRMLLRSEKGLIYIVFFPPWLQVSTLKESPLNYITGVFTLK